MFLMGSNPCNPLVLCSVLLGEVPTNKEEVVIRTKVIGLSIMVQNAINEFQYGSEWY